MSLEGRGSSRQRRASSELPGPSESAEDRGEWALRRSAPTCPPLAAGDIQLDMATAQPRRFVRVLLLAGFIASCRIHRARFLATIIAAVPIETSNETIASLYLTNPDRVRISRCGKKLLIVRLILSVVVSFVAST